MPSDSAARLQAALAGRYRIERELGRGGMATVYLAYDLRQERPVALKVIHAELAALAGMCFAVVMGLVGGCFPAWRAARMPVVQALR